LTIFFQEKGNIVTGYSFLFVLIHFWRNLAPQNKIKLLLTAPPSVNGSAPYL
jgi:hypothetical protein